MAPPPPPPPPPPSLSPLSSPLPSFTTPSCAESLIPFSTPPPPEAEEKKSFAVATGEIFLCIAERLILRNAERESNKKLEFIEKASNGGSVNRDVLSAEESVVWEQREKVIEAEKKRGLATNPGFSFSAAGLLFPYHLSVAKLLIEKGYIKESTPLADASAGAIVCAMIASGATTDEALQVSKVVAEDCRHRGTAFRLGAGLITDIRGKIKYCADFSSVFVSSATVAVTRILWRPRALLVDQFDSKEDLIDAVLTSSFIPGYLAPRPATMFPNRLCIDGDLTLIMPPTSAEKTVRVCAFPTNRMGLEGIGISPDLNNEYRGTLCELVSNHHLVSHFI